MILSPEQIKVARSLLGWTQEQLAGNTGVSGTTIRHLESGRRQPSALIVSTIRSVFEAAGVAFDENGRAGLRVGK